MNEYFDKDVRIYDFKSGADYSFWRIQQGIRGAIEDLERAEKHLR